MSRSAAAHRRLVRLVAGAAVLALVGCSLVVSSEVGEFRCSGTAPSSCPSGTTCDPVARRCVSDAGAIPVEAGDEDADGDAGDAGDGGPTLLELGSQCRLNADCRSKLCGTSTILTTTITGVPGPICTTPCCTSTECSAGFVCFNGGTGGGYCVPSALAQRTPPATGGKGPGATCAAHGDCRSGLCTGSPKRCLDTCCEERECGGDTVCRVKAVGIPGPTHEVWVCALPEASAVKDAGETCTDSNECTASACIGFQPQTCRPPCSNTASCRAVAGFELGHCLYGPSSADVIKFCAATTFDTRAATGAPCPGGTNAECQSDYCDGELKKCANVCARDRDCAASEACRPSAVNTPFLRCVPK